MATGRSVHSEVRGLEPRLGSTRWSTRLRSVAHITSSPGRWQDCWPPLILELVDQSMLERKPQFQGFFFVCLFYFLNTQHRSFICSYSPKALVKEDTDLRLGWEALQEDMEKQQPGVLYLVIHLQTERAIFPERSSPLPVAIAQEKEKKKKKGKKVILGDTACPTPKEP